MTIVKNISWPGFIALLAMGLFTVIISCDQDDVVPVYPNPDFPQTEKYELADYLGAYQVMDDACNEWLGSYSIAVMERFDESGQDEATISNFSRCGEDLKAHMKNGRLEIPYQTSYVNGVICEVEGYVYPNGVGGLKFFMYTNYEDYEGQKIRICEVNFCCRTGIPGTTPGSG